MLRSACEFGGILAYSIVWFGDDHKVGGRFESKSLCTNAHSRHLQKRLHWKLSVYVWDTRPWPYHGDLVRSTSFVNQSDNDRIMGENAVASKPKHRFLRPCPMPAYSIVFVDGMAYTGVEADQDVDARFL